MGVSEPLHFADMKYQTMIIQSYKSTCDIGRSCQHHEQKIIWKKIQSINLGNEGFVKQPAIQPLPKSYLTKSFWFRWWGFPSLFASLPLFWRTFCFLFAHFVLVLIDVSGVTLISRFLSPRLEFVNADISFVKFSICVVEIHSKKMDLCEGILHNFSLDEQKWLKNRALDGAEQLPQFSMRQRPVDCIQKNTTGNPFSSPCAPQISVPIYWRTTVSWCFGNDEQPYQPFLTAYSLLHEIWNPGFEGPGYDRHRHLPSLFHKSTSMWHKICP